MPPRGSRPRSATAASPGSGPASAPREVREGSCTVHRRGDVLTTCEVASDRPGRLAGPPRGPAPATRPWPERAERCWPACRASSACGSWTGRAGLLIRYDPTRSSARRGCSGWPRRCSTARAAGASCCPRRPGTQFGPANMTLGVAALADFVVPALAPVSAVLLVGTNLRTLQGRLAPGPAEAVRAAGALHRHRGDDAGERPVRGLGPDVVVLPVLARPAPRRPGGRAPAAAGGVPAAPPAGPADRGGGRRGAGRRLDRSGDGRPVRGGAGRALAGRRPGGRGRGDRRRAGGAGAGGGVAEAAGRRRARRLDRARRLAADRGRARRPTGRGRRRSAGPWSRRRAPRPARTSPTLRAERFAERPSARRSRRPAFGLLVGDLAAAGAILRPDYATGPGLSVPLETLRDAARCAGGGSSPARPTPSTAWPRST